MKIGKWYFLVAKTIVQMIGVGMPISIGLSLIVFSLFYAYFTIVVGKITISWTWPLFHFIQPIQMRHVLYSIIPLLLGLALITLILILEEEDDVEE